MKKRKAPVLTSPWKVGFLVSLLLILTSIGVNFTLMRTFKLSWSWLNLDPGKLAFHPGQFIAQMAPQLSILIILCIVAYFTVTSAVRKYKTYVDSGHDYKNLIKSIKGVADLNDESALKKLDAYPELRNLLADLRAKVSEQERIVERQVDELEAKANRDDLNVQFKEECTRLAAAIRERIASGGEREWDPRVTNAELREVADAVSAIPVASRSRCGGEERERMAQLHQELQEAGGYIRARLEEISRELGSNGREAKNIEAQIGALKTAVEQDDSAGRGVDALSAMEQLAAGLSDMQRLSESLQELGEETKSMAVGTALQAGSGEGTLADLIQLAEGVKEIAEKFEHYAESFMNITGQTAKLSSSLHSQIKSGASRQDPAVSSAVNTLASKMSLWVERILILADTIQTLEKSYTLLFQTLEQRISGYAELNAAEKLSQEAEQAEEPRENETPAKEDDVFEIQSSGADLFHRDGGQEAYVSERRSPLDAGLDFEERPVVDLGSPRGAAERADVRGAIIEGLEREQKIFSDARREDERRHSGSPIEPSMHPAEFEVEADHIRPPSLSATDARFDSAEQGELGAVRFDTIAHPAGETEQAGAAGGPERGASYARPESPRDDGEEIFDLYALGAVDFAAHHAGSQL